MIIPSCPAKKGTFGRRRGGGVRKESVKRTLRFIGALRDGVGGVDGLREASSIAISPDGLRLNVAAEGDHGVAVFERHPETGFLHLVEARLESQSLLVGESPGRRQ